MPSYELLNSNLVGFARRFCRTKVQSLIPFEQHNIKIPITVDHTISISDDDFDEIIRQEDLLFLRALDEVATLYKGPISYALFNDIKTFIAESETYAQNLIVGHAEWPLIVSSELRPFICIEDDQERMLRGEFGKVAGLHAYSDTFRLNKVVSGIYILPSLVGILYRTPQTFDVVEDHLEAQIAFYINGPVVKIV